MFGALLAYPQEVAAQGLEWKWSSSSTSILVQPTDITRTQYTKCRLFLAPPEDEQIMLETCKDP
jgi:hypothetical protein